MECGALDVPKPLRGLAPRPRGCKQEHSFLFTWDADVHAAVAVKVHDHDHDHVNAPHS